MVLIDNKFRWRMSGIPKKSLYSIKSDPKLLYITEHLQRFGQVRIAVIRQTGSSEILGCHLAEGAAGTVDLDPILAPVNPRGSIG